jgi:hypothetical protein
MGYHCRELLSVHRLGHMGLKAFGEYAAPVFHAGSGSERGRRNAGSSIRGQASHLSDELVAVLSWHGQVAEENIGNILSQGLEGLLR